MKHSSPEPRKSPAPPSTEAPAPGTERAFSEDGVDLTLIRWMLGLTPTERLEAAQDMIDTAWAVREGSGGEPP